MTEPLDWKELAKRGELQEQIEKNAAAWDAAQEAKAKRPQSLVTIDPTTVSKVLIAGEWYDVDSESFVVDASYEIIAGSEAVGFETGEPGFLFCHNGETVAGPLSSVQAFKMATTRVTP